MLAIYQDFLILGSARRINLSQTNNETMRNRINKAIAHLNLEIAGGGRDGCFYFVDTITDTCLIEAESVYVSAKTHLTVKEWVKEAEHALQVETESQ